MKILQINKFFWLKGGAERYFFDLAELLFEKGHQVAVWSTRHSQNFSFSGQDDFAEFSDFSKREGFLKDFKKVRRIFWNREAAKKLEKVIKKEKPDVAHLHNIFGHFSPSIIFTLKKHKIPIVATLHDYKFFCPNYLFFSNNKICFDCLREKKYRSCIFKKCVKDSYTKSLIGYLEGKWQRDFLKISQKIDFFLAPSLFVKKKALEWGIPFNKIVQLSNFINIDNFGKIGQNVNGKQRDKKYILYFGRLSEEKGIELLLKVFLKISKKLPDWQLKIVGQGPEKEKLEDLAKGYKQVELLGEKRDRQLKTIIVGSYLVITPSVCPETFSYSTLESFAFGKSVLAANVGGLPELVKSGETGLLFKPGSKNDLAERIFWAVNHSREMKRMGENAREKVLKKYNSEEHYKKLIKIYERIKNN